MEKQYFRYFCGKTKLYEEGEFSQFVVLQNRTRILDLYSNTNEYTKGYQAVTNLVAVEKGFSACRFPHLLEQVEQAVLFFPKCAGC
jgi:hypothetical protein